MNISKSDALAYLAKWYNANAEVLAVYRSLTGAFSVVGKLKELSTSEIKIAGTRCEIRLFFSNTSEYDYKDTREPATEANRERLNKYPIFISIQFSNRDCLQISEFFQDVQVVTDRELAI